MKIGLVGYQGSGKSTAFEWLTGVAGDPSLSHTTQHAMAAVPDERLDKLCDVYHPKKVVTASIELVDTPGLNRTHEGNAARLGLIREASCLVLVVAAFDGTDPVADARNFEEDVLLADLEIVSNRLDRLKQALKKPHARAEREALEAELALLAPLVAAMEDGQALRDVELSGEQRKLTRAFGLITQKPRLVIVNTADDEENPQRFQQAFAEAFGDRFRVVAVPLGLELELSRMTPEDRHQFEQEMGLEGFDRDSLVRTLLEVSGQIVFFTATEKEVRCWMLRRGATAIEAAGDIHTDMARGFIRSETFACEDVIRLGSEREVKAAGLVHQEPKDYLVQDGDVLFIKFNV